MPRDGEFGADTWKDHSNRYSGNVNVWSTLSGDDELGHVYLPLTTPNSDYWGGFRKGDDLFAESLVAVDVETGKRVWHFQAVHHGVWDFDFPCAPTLLDIVVSGKPIKAIAQASKQGFLYVFDRVTGTPVWPIEEREVPAVRHPRRGTLADAAVPDAASGVRSSGRRRNRSDRLHAGVEGAGAGDSQALQIRTAVHAAIALQERQHARDDQFADGDRRRELERIGRRSGHGLSVCAVEDRARHDDVDASAEGARNGGRRSLRSMARRSRTSRMAKSGRRAFILHIRLRQPVHRGCRWSSRRIAA